MILTAGNSTTVSLAAGHALAIAVSTGATGSVTRLSEPMGGEPFSPVPISGSDVTVGPHAEARRYSLICTAGALTYTQAPVDYPTLAEGTAAALAAAALVHLSVSGLAIGNLIEIIGDGAPAASAQATRTVNPAGDDNALTYTAVVYGAGGHAISIRYVDPAANDAALAVSVVGSAITVSLATGVAGAITSTAAEVLAAIEASAPAAALVTVAIATSDSGVADDGSGVVTAMSVLSLAGGTGVGIGTAGPGSRYTDITNVKLYLNGGTAAQPDWKIVTSA